MDIRQKVQDIISDMSLNMESKLDSLKVLLELNLDENVKDLLERYIIYLYKLVTLFYKENKDVVYSGQYFCSEDETSIDAEIISTSYEDVKEHIIDESIDDGLEVFFIRRVVLGKEVNYIEACFNETGEMVGIMSSEPSEEQYYFLAD